MLPVRVLCLVLWWLLQDQSVVVVSGFRAAPTTSCLLRRPTTFARNGIGPLAYSELQNYGSRTKQRRSLVALRQTGEATPDSEEDDPAARKRRLAAGMAFLTGIADMIFFLEFQCFATMMSGNMLRLSKAMVESKFKVSVYFVTVFASYMTGIALLRLMRKKPSKFILRISAAAVATLFVAADLLYYPSKAKWMSVPMLATSFGMINAIGTDFAGTLTFVVTGHLTKLTHLFTDWCVERKTLSELDIALAKQSMAVTVGFFGGALMACFLDARNLLLRKGIFSTMGVLYGLLFVSYDGKRIKRWWKRRGFREMAVVEVLVNDEVISDAILEEKDVLALAAINSTATVAHGEE